MSRPAQRHDSAFKLLLAHPTFARELLTGFLTPELAALFDLDTLLNPYATETLSRNAKRRLADLCWSVKVAGIELWVLIILEFQARNDRHMLLRVLQSVINHWRWALHHKKAPHVPPVLPIVLNHGTRPWNAASSSREILPAELPEALWPYQVQFRYFVIDGVRYRFDELMASVNLFARALALVRVEDEALIDRAAAELARLVHRRIAEEDRDEVRHLLAHFAHLESRQEVPVEDWDELLQRAEAELEEPTMLANVVQRLVKRGRMEGLQVGRMEGRVEGRMEGLREGEEKGKREGEALIFMRLFARRFGEAALERWRGRIEAADAETLLEWGERLLFAKTPEEVFEAQ